MISRESLFACALTLAIGAALGGLLWWDATSVRENAATILQSPQFTAPAEPPAAALDPATHQPAQIATPPANGLYRCEQGGRTTYQAHPCARGAVQSEVARGAVSVFDGRAQTEQLARVQAMRPAPDQRQETAFGEIKTEERGSSRDSRCQALLREIESVDAQGRRENKPPTLERLRKERRDLVEKMHELRCSRIPEGVMSRY